MIAVGLGVSAAGIVVKGGSQISDYVIGKGQIALVTEQIRLDEERTINLLRLDEERCKSATYLSELEQVSSKNYLISKKIHLKFLLLVFRHFQYQYCEINFKHSKNIYVNNKLKMIVILCNTLKKNKRINCSNMVIL